MPSNEEDAAGAAVLTVDCTALSGAPVVAPRMPWRGRSFFGCAASSLFGEIVARRGETSFLEDQMTVTPPGSFATAGSGTASVSASASAKTVVALSIPLFSLTNDACWLRGRERYGEMAVMSSSDAPVARRCVPAGSGRQAAPSGFGGSAQTGQVPSERSDRSGGFAVVANRTALVAQTLDARPSSVGAPRPLTLPAALVHDAVALGSPPKVRRWPHEPRLPSPRSEGSTARGRSALWSRAGRVRRPRRGQQWK